MRISAGEGREDIEKEGCRSVRPSSRSSLCLLESEMARNRGHAAAKRRDELGVGQCSARNSISARLIFAVDAVHFSSRSSAREAVTATAAAAMKHHVCPNFDAASRVMNDACEEGTERQKNSEENAGSLP